MKTCAFFLFFCLLEVGGEIPLVYPKNGETRPDWWLTSWSSDVLVFKGRIEVKQDQTPDLEVRSLSLPGDDGNSVPQNSKRIFYVGKIEIQEVLFVTEGVLSRVPTLRNQNVESPVFVLVPIIVSPDVLEKTEFRQRLFDDERIFVVRLTGSIPKVSLLYDSFIPKNSVNDAEELFLFLRKKRK